MLSIKKPVFTPKKCFWVSGCRLDDLFREFERGILINTERVYAWIGRFFRDPPHAESVMQVTVRGCHDKRLQPVINEKEGGPEERFVILRMG